MKKIIAFVTIMFVLMISLASCNETQSDTSTKNSGEFGVGEKLLTPAGDNFKMPINGRDGYFITFTTLNVTKLKEADINNVADYLCKPAPVHDCEGFYFYYRYLYTVKIEGQVDKSLAGQKISISLAFENQTLSTESNAYTTTVGSDGKIQLEYIAYSNRDENVVIPSSVSID